MAPSRKAKAARRKLLEEQKKATFLASVEKREFILSPAPDESPSENIKTDEIAAASTASNAVHLDSQLKECSSENIKTDEIAAASTASNAVHLDSQLKECSVKSENIKTDEIAAASTASNAVHLDSQLKEYSAKDEVTSENFNEFSCEDAFKFICKKFVSIEMRMKKVETDIIDMRKDIIDMRKEFQKNAADMSLAKKVALENSLIYVNEALKLMVARLNKLESTNQLEETYKRRTKLSGEELQKFISDTKIIREVSAKLRKPRNDL